MKAIILATILLVAVTAATTVAAESASGSSPVEAGSSESAKSVQESSLEGTTPKPMVATPSSSSGGGSVTPLPPTPPTPPPTPVPFSPPTATVFTVTLPGGETGSAGQIAILEILKKKYSITASEVEFVETTDPNAPKGSISFVFKADNGNTRGAAQGLRAAVGNAKAAEELGFGEIAAHSAPVENAPPANEGLSTGLIVAIAIGGAVLLLLIGGIIFKATRSSGGDFQAEDPEELSPSKQRLLNEDHYDKSGAV